MVTKSLNFIFDYPFSYSKTMKDQDKINYVAALLKISDVDGISKDEEQIISNVLTFCYWNDDILENAKKVYKSKSFNELMPSAEIKSLFFPYLLRDAIIIAHIHKGISEQEEEQLKKIAYEMGYYTDYYETDNKNESYYEKIKRATTESIDAVLRLNELINS